MSARYVASTLTPHAVLDTATGERGKHYATFTGALKAAARLNEQERLFTPAPEPMPGQTEMPGDFDG